MKKLNKEQLKRLYLFLRCETKNYQLKKTRAIIANTIKQIDENYRKIPNVEVAAIYYNDKIEKINLTPKQQKNNIHKSYKNKAQAFYTSQEWRNIRYEVLKKYNGKCALCGRSAKDGVVLHVDHIIPLSKNWNKRLDINNLQVLCEDCNLGKSNKDCIKW